MSASAPVVAPRDEFTVAGLIRRLAGSQPDHEMLVSGDDRRTWSEEYERACRVAQACERDGTSVGDRVAFLDRNGMAYFDVLFGGSFLGAVNVAVNWRLAPNEMAAIIDDARARILFVHTDYLEALEHMTSDLLSVQRIVVLRDASSVEKRSSDARAVSFDEWIEGCDAVDPGHVGESDEVSMQLYTSGTTGLPKGVMLTNANLSTAISEAGTTFRIAGDTVSLVAMPLFHIGGSGWALCAMSRGGRSIILRDVDPIQLLKLIEGERITEMFLVPAVLMVLLGTSAMSSTDLSSLRLIFYGASPISEDVLVRCMSSFGCEFCQVYGMTETTGAITALRPEDHEPDGPRRGLLRSAGHPHPTVELRVIDPDSGRDAELGRVGEIWTRSPYNMVGYWGKPDETAATIDVDGWLRTGDAGYLDADGYLYLHDRMKDMIVSGGENIYPAEVENVLLSHPDVADAAVIGVPDERWGETVKAIVVLAPDAALDAPGIIAHCRSNLAHYKCPTSVETTTLLPRNPSGKILKRELRAPYWKGKDRRIN
ncbi:MAG TPA: long-chain-fatty-acid--CoA ligase [Acidimicrobiales bacterium]|nr:long-chain-fatty-acid--CoA ligase [Acidimicrobiales bacterium]